MIDFRTYVKLSKLFSTELTKDTLGHTRRSLPQIKDIHDFKRFLLRRHVRFKETELEAKKLKPSQKHLNPEKMAALLHKKADKTQKLIIVSDDLYVLDGHHRWAVAVIRNETIKVLVVDKNIEELLELIDCEYDKATYTNLK